MRRLIGVLLMLVGLVGSLLAFSAQPAGAVVIGTDPQGTLTGFEIEGDQDDDAFPAIDWATAGATVVEDDILDSGLSGTSKENDPSDFVCNVGGANPGKNNILGAAVNTRISDAGAFLDLAYAREVGQGDAHVNFEFNQEPAGYDCPNSEFDGRTDGDILLAFDFPGGSDAPNIEGFIWDSSVSADGQWIQIAQFPPGAAAGSSNSADIPNLIFDAPVPAVLPARTFGEVSLDLEAIFPELFAGDCVTFGTLNVRSRSSGESFNSALQDRLEPTPLDFSTCGSITIKKVDNATPGAPLADAVFGLFDNADATGDPIATCTSDDDGLCSFPELDPGTYWIKELSAPAGYDPDPDIVGPIVVDPLEDVDLTGDPFVNEMPITIDVTKDANPTSIDEPGGPVVFSVTLENTSPEPLTVTSLTDDVFGDITSVHGDITATDCATGDVLAPAAVYSCSFTATVAGNAGDVHTDTVTGAAEDDEGNEATDADDAVVEITDVEPIVTVVKDPSPSQLTELGGDVTYTVQIGNPVGSVEPITVVSIEDDRFGTLAGDADCQVGTVLDPGETCQFQFTETLPGQDPGTTHVNVVTVHATDDDGNDVDSSDPATVTFTDILPEVTIVKDAAPTSVPETGGNVTFTFTVTNDGDEAGTITSLSDDRFGALAGDADCQVGTVLAAGASCSFQLVVPLAQDEGTTHTNVATVVLSDDDGNTDSDDDNAVVSFTDVLPEITVDKTANPTSAPEATPTDITFSVTVTNHNAEAVTLTTLTDDVFGDLDGAGTCNVPVVLAGNGGTYSCQFVESLTGNVGDDHVDTVTATASDDDGNTDSDDDDATVTFVDGLPTITVEKSADPVSLPELGGDVTFTVVVTNTSVEPVEITSLEDDIFGTLDGDADCQVGTVLAANGGSCEFDFTEAVNGNAGFVHVNTVTVVAVDDEDNEAEADDDATVTITDVDSSIEVTKTADPTSVPEPGDDVTFTVEIENTSAVDSITIDSIVDDVFGDLGDAGNAAVSANTCPGLIGDELAVGASTSCTFSAFIGDDAVVGDDAEHHDTVLVSGTDDDDLPVADDDDATVDITDVLPSVTVVKDADVESVPENTPTEVTFTVTVTNGSVEPVTIESLDDSVFGTLAGDADCEVGTVLPVGGSCTFEFTGTLNGDAGADHQNVAEACVADDEDNTECDDDPEVVPFTDIPPTVTVDKESNATELTVGTATPVVFTVVVTNTSKEAVTITSLTDSVFGTLAGDADCKVGTVLPVGGSCTFTFTETLTLGTAGHTNVVTVVVTDDEGSTGTDDDNEVIPATEVLPTVEVRTPAPLPRTGANTQHLVLLALGMILIGFGLVLGDVLDGHRRVVRR